MDTLDPQARRRLQNRLNQRASRKRKALEAKKQKWIVYTEESNSPDNALIRTKATHQVTQLPPPPPPGITIHCLNHLTPTQRRQYIAYLQALAAHMLETPVISPTLTFCLTQYNSLRAMGLNASLMGLTLEILDEDLASQFNIDGFIMTHLPASLLPSPKQRKILHHPWVDLLPMVSLREALLDREGILDEDQVCEDLYGTCLSSEVGLRVWGESWDPFAYEVSEILARKWTWLATECPDIIKSTNYWRKQRGEKAIVVEIS
ncbi:uncharacterized protein N7515_005004 [Penicillium bovifimosum]|uniref:BZIP domain-containing protein n=1 Tax=Penicillium bovifimosum TaxID=126998 RepID=A0A9W9H2M4_9EURO|nr:uncharacterized protein N7515_005004 [Penicillium bovifimosum]KAJ5135726.1 hypothetical protein N7515_005004 [Penicillium bovifimosum]